ncbi:hypothetical protein DRE_07478 [Drechslerella stenobrocha 248]|uniref:Nudix hydrolase domain-containing protein n=1 Tax=Drechslerella stenobrocha 248 TaxID=1043628 RepID=W7HI35_9PEZI|nr:hypothetical protein DRE_07478 [Drechslerella stenobrocha 248]
MDHNLYLKRLLQDLTARPVHDIAKPDKRASVAIVIRLRPQLGGSEQGGGEENIHRRSSRKDPYKYCHPGDVEDVFAEAWTKDAIAEILFIKRASRTGDRWAGDVALPGGGRDKDDAGDAAAATRECMEEVGLDLISGDVLLCGALPQRVIVTNWAQKPLMVLCPYVFLWTTKTIPPLRLQASEIAVAFWVPVPFLLDGKHRKYHPVDVSDRVAGRLQLLRPVFRLVLGPMHFSAIRLEPRVLQNSTCGDEGPFENLMLWGISYAVLADMLDLLPPFNFVEKFEYPFFHGWDYQTLVWVLSKNYRREREEEVARYKFSHVIGMTSKTRDIDTRPSVIDYMMKDYYQFVQRAVYKVVLARLSLVVIIGYITMRMWTLWAPL